MSRPNAITVSRSRRGTTIKATGKAAQMLFDAMTVKRHAAARQAVCTVHFTDHMQDFLEWDLDGRGFVLDSRPFQREIWKGCRVMNEPEPGKLVVITRQNGEPFPIKYPVAKVVAVLPAAAAAELNPP